MKSDNQDRNNPNRNIQAKDSERPVQTPGKQQPLGGSEKPTNGSWKSQGDNARNPGKSKGNEPRH